MASRALLPVGRLGRRVVRGMAAPVLAAPAATAGEPDPSELLVKALDLVVGSVSLARYAAEHSADKRLRRVFRQFAGAGEHQERVLRQQLAGYAVAHQDGAVPGGPATPARQFVAGVTSAALAVIGALVAIRIVTAPPDDPVRRAALRALAAAGRLVGIGSGRDATAAP